MMVAVAGGLMVAHVRQRREIRALKDEQEAIIVEEKRMFDFLNGLGKTLCGEVSDAKLQRTVVDGVAEVVRADGGALYLLDKDGTQLVPGYYAAKCPPIIPLPERIVTQAKGDPNKLRGYLRLHSVPSDDGLLGRCLERARTKKKEKALRVPNLRVHPDFREAANPFQQNVAAMVAPVYYGGVPIGVLAVASNRLEGGFSRNDFDVFKSATEQSGFALGNAIVHREASEKRRQDEELRRASEIQKILLPAQSPEIEGFAIEAVNLPAKVVSGDYFDYLEMEGGKTGVVIADVSGKGTAAALVAATFRCVVRWSAAGKQSPEEILSDVNRRIFADIRQDMFISAAFLELDAGSGSVTMTRAGHDPPLLFRAATGALEALDPPGMAIGIDSGDVFDRVIKMMKVSMEPGDCILLYTDGATEARDSKDLEFGLDRLSSAFKHSAPQGAGAVVAGIRRVLDNFVGGYQQIDDITLIVIEKR